MADGEQSERIVDKLLGNMRLYPAFFGTLLFGLLLLFFRDLEAKASTPGFPEHLLGGLLVYLIGSAFIAHVHTMLDNWHKSRKKALEDAMDKSQEDRKEQLQEELDRSLKFYDPRRRSWILWVEGVWVVLFALYLLWRGCL